MSARGPLVGVDLGGTSVRAAVADAGAEHGHGPIVHRDTPADEGPERVLDVIAEAVREAAGGEPAGVAIGIPGPLDPRTGVVHTAPHLRGWDGLAARDLLAERTGCPVAIHNDASLAGFAEWTHGAGQGAASFVYITVSTGIGGAIIRGGDLLTGVAGTAAELGHVPAHFGGATCGAGHPGCLEGLASGTAIARRARDAVEAGEASALRVADLEHLSARDVEQAARNGDALAARIYREAALGVGYWLGGLVNVLGPDVIAVGGGLINAGELLFDPLHEGLAAFAFGSSLPRVHVVPAQLGTDAGLVGAVGWAVRSFSDA